MDFSAAQDAISQIEQIYFTGVFRESVIREDLQNRKLLDNLKRSSGKYSNELEDKRDFYIKDFNNVLDNAINFILEVVQTHRSWDTTLINRCKRCKSELEKLLNIVRNF